MLEHFVVELGGLQLGSQFHRHRLHDRLELLGQPLVRHDRLVRPLLVGAGAVVVKIIKQPPSLVLLGIHPGEPDQPARMVPSVDDLGLDSDG